MRFQAIWRYYYTYNNSESMEFNPIVNDHHQEVNPEPQISMSPISKHSFFELFSISIKTERYFAKVFPLDKTHLFTEEKLLLEMMTHPSILKPVDSNFQLAARLANFLKNEVLLFPEASRGSFQNYIQKNGFLSEKVTKYYISQLIQALLYCETVGARHPNLSPSNLLMDENRNLLLCGWTNSSQIIASSTKTLPFRLGELIVYMMTSRNLFVSPSLKNDTYGKFLSETHIHKLWQQLQKVCKRMKNFSLSSEMKKLVSALFLGNIKSLEEIKESEWLQSVPTLQQIAQQLMQKQFITANRL